MLEELRKMLQNAPEWQEHDAEWTTVCEPEILSVLSTIFHLKKSNYFLGTMPEQAQNS